MIGESAYRGGRVDPDEPLPDQPRRMRYPCFANGCPMPGTLFPEHARQGVCSWHYNVQPTDIPKVTGQLQAWECVAREIDQARRVLCGPLAADPAGQDAAFVAAWSRLRPLLSAEWEQHLQPGDERRQSYADWAKHLERFLGARVVEVLSTHRRSDAAELPFTQRDPAADHSEEPAPW